MIKKESRRNAKLGIGPLLVVCEATGSYDAHVLESAALLEPLVDVDDVARGDLGAALDLIGSTYEQMGRPEEAAMTLLTGSAVSGDRGLLEEVMGLYRSGLDVEGCSLAGSGSAAALSPRCPMVLRHSCQAFAAAYQILRKAGYDARADQTKTAAVAGLRCSADLMEQTSSLVP